MKTWGKNVYRLSENNKYIYSKVHSGSGYQPMEINEMSDKNIEVIKHIQATGKCLEDDIMATSMYSESGYQPKKVHNPPTPTKGSSAVSPKTHRKDIKFELDLDKPIERTDDLFISHLQNEIEWYKRRMNDYKKSFYMICDLIKSSNVPDSIKYFVELEEKRY